MTEYRVHLRKPHALQAGFIHSKAKRKIIRAGRRSGKTVGISIYAVERFLANRRVLYAAPTHDQTQRFWYEITKALQELIDGNQIYKNETMHVLEIPGTETRIRAKTAWNANTLRGDYADDLILDEFQLMDEEVWGVVGAPMLADNNGNATFIYTPPSLRSRSISRAKDPQYAAKMFKRAKLDETGRWEAFHFTSRDNPHISQEAVDDLAKDMSALAYRMEILAEDVDEAPGALWKRDTLEKGRSDPVDPEKMELIIVGVDPAATSTGNNTGIITVGKREKQIYVMSDDSIQGSPKAWATQAVEAYLRFKANKIVAESNQGGEMVKQVISQVDPSVPVELVNASRGKQTRAEPVATVFEQGKGHMAGYFYELEDELCLWTPGDPSPDRLDAMVWAASSLIGQTWWMS